MIKLSKQIQLEKGDVLSCISNGKLAKLIKAFTKSRINHSAYVVDVWEELYVIDSQRDGSNLRKLEEWKEKYNYQVVIHRKREYSEKTYKAEAKKALEKSGMTPYDFKSLLWYQPIYQITGKWKGKKNEDAEKRMYCSEFVAYVIGLPEYWRLSPAEVYEQLLINKNYITL